MAIKVPECRPPGARGHHSENYRLEGRGPT
jgi:hypothetical protein